MYLMAAGCWDKASPPRNANNLIGSPVLWRQAKLCCPGSPLAESFCRFPTQTNGPRSAADSRTPQRTHSRPTIRKLQQMLSVNQWVVQTWQQCS
ncbi:hypothetical protein GN956_G4958 [Arapaima gigas]